MSNFVALYDACVLYPASLRDLLLRLGLTGLYRARWTAQIEDEWVRSLLHKRPELSAKKLNRTRELMRKAIPDCIVTGYEGLEQTLQLPDPDDCHVLAAAILCHAGTIVTYNTKDFPDDVLKPLGISAQHPDEFIEHALHINAGAVCSAVKKQRASLRHPPMDVQELLQNFLGLGLASTVTALRDNADLL